MAARHWPAGRGPQTVFQRRAADRGPPVVSRRSLPAHLERVVLRLTAARASGRIDEAFDAVIDRAARELDLARASGGGVRGEARQALIDRLAALDGELLQAARAALDEPSRGALARSRRGAGRFSRVHAGRRVCPGARGRDRSPRAPAVRPANHRLRVMLSPGDVLPLTIDKAAAGGRMIARVNGQVVLVAGAIPGERVTASIERVAKGVAYATTVSVEEPSPDRRESADPLMRRLSLRVHRVPAAARDQGVDRRWTRSHGSRGLRCRRPFAWRRRPRKATGCARAFVRGRRIGFFREGTHEVCDVRQTRQLLPETCDALDRLSAGLRSVGPRSCARD